LISDEDIQAQDLLKRGKIHQALAIYQQLEPDSPRILNSIGELYAEKKGEYDLAINYHEQALQLQGKL
jgi:tetratricopeptide (TPR) repeat protein